MRRIVFVWLFLAVSGLYASAEQWRDRWQESFLLVKQAIALEQSGKSSSQLFKYELDGRTFETTNEAGQTYQSKLAIWLRTNPQIIAWYEQEGRGQGKHAYEYIIYLVEQGGRNSYRLAIFIVSVSHDKLHIGDFNVGDFEAGPWDLKKGLVAANRVKRRE